MVQHIEVSVVTDLSSDHNPLLTTVREHRPLTNFPLVLLGWSTRSPTTTSSLRSFLHFNRSLPCDDVDNRAEYLQEAIQTVMNRHTKNAPVRTEKQNFLRKLFTPYGYGPSTAVNGEGHETAPLSGDFKPSLIISSRICWT